MTRQQTDGAVVIDTRPADMFASGHLRGSINVGLDGRFAEYAGDVLRPGQSVILVTEPGLEREAHVRLARIGFDHVIGARHRHHHPARRSARPRDSPRRASPPRSSRSGVGPSRTSRSSTSATRASVSPGSWRSVNLPLPDSARSPRRARSESAHRRLLRRGLPLRHRGLGAAGRRLHDRRRTARRLQRRSHVPAPDGELTRPLSRRARTRQSRAGRSAPSTWRSTVSARSTTTATPDASRSASTSSGA